MKRFLSATYVYTQIARVAGRIGSRKRAKMLAAANGAPFVADMPGIGARMLIDPSTYFANIYIAGSFEPLVVRYMKKNLRPGMTCIDIGANVGYFSLLMAKLVGDGQVYAFEPTPTTYDLLRKNADLNQIKNIDARNCAITNYSGTACLHIGPARLDVYNSLGAVTHPSATKQVFDSIHVPCYTLDQFVTDSHINTIDFIKIDVEGSELFVLEGMEKTLSLNPQLTLLIELADQTTQGFGYKAQKVVDWLHKHGWKLTLLEEPSNIKFANDPDWQWTGQMVVVSKA